MKDQWSGEALGPCNLGSRRAKKREYSSVNRSVPLTKNVDSNKESSSSKTELEASMMNKTELEASTMNKTEAQKRTRNLCIECGHHSIMYYCTLLVKIVPCPRALVFMTG